MIILGISVAVVVLGVMILMLSIGISAKQNMPAILAVLEKRPLNVSVLIKQTGKSRRVVVSSLLTMQDKGYIRTGTKGGMKKLSAIGDHTTFYITAEGREFLHS